MNNNPHSGGLEIEVSDRQHHSWCSAADLAGAVRFVLQAEGIVAAQISLAIVDDPAIHELNRQYLNHDYATDVLSFTLSSADDDLLEGEIIVSSDTALREAESRGHAPAEELMLYAVHGALHILGYEDGTPQQRKNMEARQEQLIAQFQKTWQEDSTA